MKQVTRPDGTRHPRRWIDHSWTAFLPGFLFDAKIRRICENDGTHRPQLIDLGRSKMCMRCGTW